MCGKLQLHCFHGSLIVRSPISTLSFKEQLVILVNSKHCHKLISIYFSISCISLASRLRLLQPLHRFPRFHHRPQHQRLLQIRQFGRLLVFQFLSWLGMARSCTASTLPFWAFQTREMFGSSNTKGSNKRKYPLVLDLSTRERRKKRNLGKS